jgi:hypothetical protein
MTCYYLLLLVIICFYVVILKYIFIGLKDWSQDFGYFYRAIFCDGFLGSQRDCYRF